MTHEGDIHGTITFYKERGNNDPLIFCRQKIEVEGSANISVAWSGEKGGEELCRF